MRKKGEEGGLKFCRLSRYSYCDIFFGKKDHSSECFCGTLICIGMDLIHKLFRVGLASIFHPFAHLPAPFFLGYHAFYRELRFTLFSATFTNHRSIISFFSSSLTWRYSNSPCAPLALMIGSKIFILADLVTCASIPFNG